MATQTGTHLNKNPYKTAMNSSIPIGLEISTYVYDALYANRLDADITPLYDYYGPKHLAFLAEAGVKTEDFVERKAATKQVVISNKDLKPNLTEWIRQINDLHRKGTAEYDRLLIGGTESFYNGSRAQKLLRINALILAFGIIAEYAALKILVMAYRDSRVTKTATQTTKKNAVNTAGTNVNTLRNACTNGLWYVLCGLLMIDIEHPELALAYFPMELIYKASRMIIKTLLVPAHSVRKICSHTWKPGETATLTNNRDVPLQVGLALSATSPVLVWYTLGVGITIELDPRLLGNIAFKFIMVKNDDLMNSGDITFTINQL